MKHLRYAALAVFALALLAGSAEAQKRTAKKSTTKKSTSTQSTVPPLDVRTAREKVSIQLANVNRFVDVLGPVAQGIETLDRSAGTKPLSPTAADKNEANKEKVIAAIRNLRVGLSLLEADFRTKTALRKYLPTIEGITDLAARSEDSAIAGKFVAAKDPLRDAAQKLTDTLAVLPFSPQ